MAKGRQQIYRRKHKGRSRTTAARNTKPRASSPEGVEARHERRLNAHPKANIFASGGQEGKPPGSRNPKKVGR